MSAASSGPTSPTVVPVVVFPTLVATTALALTIAADHRWPMHDWRWIGLVDIGTRRPICTQGCIFKGLIRSETCRTPYEVISSIPVVRVSAKVERG